MEFKGKRIELYNVRKLSCASDTLCIGSTVTLASIERAGYVPLVRCVF